MNCTHFFKTLLLFFCLNFATSSLMAETTAVAPALGDGSSGNPYQISTLAELRWVSENDSSWDKDFIITADIDAADTSTWNSGKGFSPIGTYSVPAFTGIFSNADSFVISNLYISRPDQSRVGLFGYIDGAVIQRVLRQRGYKGHFKAIKMTNWRISVSMRSMPEFKT